MPARCTRVGPRVENLHPGEAVIAVTPSVVKTGLMASQSVVPAELVFRKPANLSWEEAATLSLAFLTARYGLQTLAGMRRGERVLIHAGAGGVGLAAIRTGPTSRRYRIRNGGEARKKGST